MEKSSVDLVLSVYNKSRDVVPHALFSTLFDQATLTPQEKDFLHFFFYNQWKNIVHLL